MKLSSSIYHLKRRAKQKARSENIPLHRALDYVAIQEGFARWSLLSAKAGQGACARDLFAALSPGDLLLVGARPGHGKTLLCLELALEAMKAGKQARIFSLEYTLADLLSRFQLLGVEAAAFQDRLRFFNSDEIHAGTVIEALAMAEPGTFVVIDYLQALDQRRENPELSLQIKALRAFAQKRGVIFAFISQISRFYAAENKPLPDIDDVRLPNPLDLSLFHKTCFLHEGRVRFSG